MRCRAACRRGPAADLRSISCCVVVAALVAAAAGDHRSRRKPAVAARPRAPRPPKSETSNVNRYKERKMEVILLERVAKLGQMGETVRVKDGFARNFLLPRGKALRATEGQQEEIRGPAPSARGAQSRTQGRGRRRRREARRPELHHHPPGRRNRPALRFGVGARHRRGDHRGRLLRPSQPDRAASADQEARPSHARRCICIRR